VIVVDNASHDGTVEALHTLKDLPFRLRVIQSQENLGFSRGHNLAARESRGEYLLLLNTDTTLLHDALHSLTSFYLHNNPSEHKPSYNPKNSAQRSFHFVGPKLLNSDLTEQPSCGPYYSIPVIIAALFFKGDYWGISRCSPHRLRQVDWVSGACFICRKAYFEELNGFDEQIFMYMDEIDFFKRARMRGFAVWFYPDAQVIHLGSASSNKKYPILQVYRGFLYLYNKHHAGFQLCVIQSILVAKALVAIALGRLLRKPRLVETYQEALAVVRDSRSR
jgi:GT2 family glycosyltransferase